MTPTINLVAKMLAEQESALTLRLAAVRFASEAVSGMKDDTEISFRVDIASSWSTYGEADTTGTYPGPLESAVAAGIAAFKAKNNRSDVQGEISVSAMLPRSGALRLPASSYAHLMHLCGYPEPAPAA